MKNTNISENQIATIRKVLRRIGRYRWLVLLSLGLSAVTVVLTLVVPILVGRAIDGILKSKITTWKRVSSNKVNLMSLSS